MLKKPYFCWLKSIFWELLVRKIKFFSVRICWKCDSCALSMFCIVKQSKNPKKAWKNKTKRSKLKKKSRLHYLSNGIANRPNFCCKQCLGGSNWPRYAIHFNKTCKKNYRGQVWRIFCLRILTEKASLHYFLLTIIHKTKVKIFSNKYSKK
jgi:hypothetical protein